MGNGPGSPEDNPPVPIARFQARVVEDPALPPGPDVTGPGRVRRVVASPKFLPFLTLSEQVEAILRWRGIWDQDGPRKVEGMSAATQQHTRATRPAQSACWRCWPAGLPSDEPGCSPPMDSGFVGGLWTESSQSLGGRGGLPDMMSRIC